MHRLAGITRRVYIQWKVWPIACAGVQVTHKQRFPTGIGLPYLLLKSLPHCAIVVWRTPKEGYSR